MHKQCNLFKGNKREALPRMDWMIKNGIVKIGDRLILKLKPDIQVSVSFLQISLPNWKPIRNIVPHHTLCYQTFF